MAALPRYARPRSTATSPIRQVRIALYRVRHVLTALVALAGVWWIVGQFAPQPDQRMVVVVTRDINSGENVTESDVALTEVPTAVLPADAATELTDIVGNSAIIGLSPGTVLTESMVAGPNLGYSLAPGEVVVPVTFADRGSLSVAKVGQEVWLYASTDEEVSRVGSAARVLAVFSHKDSGLFEANVDNITDVLVAIQASEARVLLEALSSGPLRAVLPSR